MRMRRDLLAQPEYDFRTGSRSGLTLAEVLVSMGILVIGLLGVAALFPVGGHYMRTGDVADQAGAIAQAALDDAIVQGHLDPENWLVVEFTEGLGAYIELISGNGAANGAAVSRIGLRRDLGAANGSVVGVAKTTGRAYRSAKYGDAFVIDPLGIGSALSDQTETAALVSNPFRNGVIANFPALVRQIRYNATGLNGGWGPWMAADLLWPVRRATTVHDPARLSAGATFWLNEPAAEEAFTASDDLALVFPENGDDPSRGRWATWRNSATTQPIPSSRRPRGEYSWLISVSPGSSVARDALATSPDAHQYDVSVVVFHQRALGVGLNGTREAERLVNARVVSTGTAGGELLLEYLPETVAPPATPVTESPFEDLRTGQYLMLTGPHPLSTNDRPMLFLQWYRVLTIEDSGRPLVDSSNNRARLSREGDAAPTTLTSNTARVLVSLRGPDWPWQPTNDLTQTNLTPNDLRVAIIPGAVAVHTKTMRLESGTPWSVE